MNKSALIDKIQKIEGLTAEERSDLLKLLREHKKYGLVWEDKPEAVEERLREELPVLREEKSRAIVSDAPDAPNHILIEGDNLEALTALTYTHEGKIDVIYIDPPYNTGNKDFVYNDSYVDSEDEYRHSKWLSFMAKRLRIAKRLLSDKGVIFISIDDNEQANLKLLCDEVFGFNSFVATYFWKRTSTPPALSYKVRRKLEYVLCYQKKDIQQRSFVQGYTDGGDIPLLNSGNPIGRLTFPIGSVHFGIEDGTYSHKATYKITLLNEVTIRNGINLNEFTADGHFKWSQDYLNKEIDKGTYFIIKTSKFSPRFQREQKSTKVPSNIIDDEVLVGTNEDAQKEFADFNLEYSFDYAKPTTLISFLSKMPFWYEREITILDFFAGSGTTLHATMQLNAEDGGHRQCILVTNNENNICENVTYERNKRVINGYTKPNGEEVEGLHNNTLRYYKTDFLPRERTQRNMRELVNAATALLCIKEDLYKEQKQFGKYRTNPHMMRYFADGQKHMLIVYREELLYDIVEEIKQLDFCKAKLKVYVFSPGRTAFPEVFEEVQDKVTPVALPAAIYDAYQKVLPKRKAKLEELEVESDEVQQPQDLFEGQEEGGEA